MDNGLIPLNITGKHSDLEYSALYPGRPEAAESFARARQRMLNPSCWHGLAGFASAVFTLVNADEEELRGPAREGDFMKIDIPGPGPSEGDGYDWVRIEQIENKGDPEGEEESAGLKIRPCGRPKAGITGQEGVAGEEGSEEDEGAEGAEEAEGATEAAEAAAHFFQSGATSSYIIRRVGNRVTASYHGRNELPNVSTGKVLDNVRNGLVASGAAAGLSEMQWSSLIRGFLEDGRGEKGK